MSKLLIKNIIKDIETRAIQAIIDDAIAQKDLVINLLIDKHKMIETKLNKRIIELETELQEIKQKYPETRKGINLFENETALQTC